MGPAYALAGFHHRSGLAILVLIANQGTEDLTGEALRAAMAQGIAQTAYVIGGGVTLMLLIMIAFTRAREVSGGKP